MLPPLTAPFSVDRSTIAAFQRDGHCVVRGLASPDEAAAYRPVIEAAVAANRLEQRPLEERDTYGKAFLQVTNLWRHDEGVRDFVMSPRFAGVAAALLGVDGVRLYHDQALFKEAGGGHTPFHQDQHYWPLDTDKTITMWMPLVDLAPEVGSMTFASGSRRLVGDATFHAGWTLHGAGANPTGALRSVMTVTYYADGARVTQPAHDFQEFDRQMWLRVGP